MLKRVGESRHPCPTPTVVRNQSPMLPLKKTAYEIWSCLVGSEMCIRDRLKRVGESRHPCRTPTVVQNQSPILLLKRTALVALSWRFLMTGIRLALMLYFFKVAHKAACQTLSKAFLKSMKTW